MMRRVPFHPLLFAAYPVLFLFARNLQELRGIWPLFPPLLVVIGGSVVTFTLVALLLRRIRNAAVVTSVLILLFFSFGHVLRSAGGSAAQETILLIAYAAIAVLTALAMARARDVSALTSALNWIAVVLVSMNVVSIGIHEINRIPLSEMTGVDEPPLSETVDDSTPKRDIYYLVFDHYAAASTLERLYGDDNRSFLDYLEERGFYVAGRAAANHFGTRHSLSSSLNMSYLRDLEKAHPSSGDYTPLYRLLDDPVVPRALRSIGYRYHLIGSWFAPTGFSSTADVVHNPGGRSEFASILLDTTMWPTLAHRLHLESVGVQGNRSVVHHQVKALKAVVDDPAPTFAFAHFLVPHPPYIFDRDGGPVGPEVEGARTEREDYLNQLLYVNTLIEDLVETLLDVPESEAPIVIIQADEGPYPPHMNPDSGFDWLQATGSELREKFLILNAYHLPGGHEDALYPTISPVNTFRVVFNEYFGTDLPLAEDKTYLHRSPDGLYDYVEVTDRLRGPADDGAP